jgi:hypothetical protein
MAALKPGTLMDSRDQWKTRRKISSFQMPDEPNNGSMWLKNSTNFPINQECKAIQVQVSFNNNQ